VVVEPTVQVTALVGKKSEPSTVREKVGPPAATLDGEIDEIAGPITVKLTVADCTVANERQSETPAFTLSHMGTTRATVNKVPGIVAGVFVRKVPAVG